MEKLNRKLSGLVKTGKFGRQIAKCLSALSLLSSPCISFAQADIHFSQFYETSILRNPALTGVFSDDYKLGAYYRNQWSSITNPYTTILFTAESHVPISHTTDDFLSFGLLGYSDKAGSIDQKIAAFYPALNYNKSLNPNRNSYLSVGFTGGYVQYSFDPSKATFNNQYVNGYFDPTNPSLENLPNATMNILDMGAGLNYNISGGADNKTTFIIGASVYHFTEPKFSYYQSPGIVDNMRLNGNTAFGMVVTENVSFQLQGNFAMQGTYQEIMMGGIMNWTQSSSNVTELFVVSGGVFYRYGDAVIPVFKVAYQRLALGISYDVNVSTLKEASNLQGGTELTLFYTGNYTDKGVTRKTICPKF